MGHPSDSKTLWSSFGDRASSSQRGAVSSGGWTLRRWGSGVGSSGDFVGFGMGCTGLGVGLVGDDG